MIWGLISLKTRYSSLDVWSNITGVTLDSANSKTTSWRYEQPQSIRADLGDGVGVSLMFDASFAWTPGFRSFSFEQHAWVEFSAASKLGYGSIHSALRLSGMQRFRRGWNPNHHSSRRV